MVLHEFFLIAGIHLLAVMSPGPDFAMVMRNSLVYSRRTGVLAAAGLAIGIALHVTYSLLGIGLIISKSLLLFNVIKYVGALYLIYIGVKSLMSKKSESANHSDAVISKKDLTPIAAIRLGFLTNSLNPKATLFFLALFTQVIDPSTSIWVKMLYGVEMSAATFMWFGIIATILTHKQVSTLFEGIKHHIEKVFGAVLLALGVKVALGSRQ